MKARVLRMGVTKENDKFRARVNDHGRRVSLGMFDTELKAKRAVNKWHKNNDFSQIWSDKNAMGGFEEIPMRENYRFITQKPNLFDRIKLWLKKQLDS